MPRFGLEECWDSADLPGILGDADYRTPVLDPAPWFSEARPASAKFFGFYPLNVTGIEDSSHSLNVTELVQDGAVFSLPRKASNQFRVSGLLVGEDAEGLDAGLSWLRGVLKGSECDTGDCAGDNFCYLAYLPQYCDYGDTTQYPLVPVDDQWQAGGNGAWIPYRSGTIVSNSNGVRFSMPCGGDGVQYYVEGLIPGQTYRATVEIDSVEPLTISVSGVDILTATRAAGHYPGARNPWIVDFIAKDSMETLRITSAADTCTAATARIYGIKVERTAEMLMKFLPRFTSEAFREPVSWTWYGGDVIQHAAGVAEPDSVEEITLSWINPSGSSTTIPEGVGPQRLVRGLRAGQEYLLYVKLATSNGMALDLEIADVGSVVTDLGGGWYEVAFTATQPQHYFRMLTTEEVALPGSSKVDIEVQYIRVDASAQTLYIQPVDQGWNARRSLHNVALLDGPRIVEEFNKEHGVMRSVEFTMIVGEPNIYGEMTEVQPTISATTYLVGNTECQEGYPVRYNMFTNPFLTDETVDTLPVGGVGVHSAFVEAANVDVTVVAGNDYVAENAALVVPTGTGDTYFSLAVDEADLQVGHVYTMSATLSMLEAQTGVLEDLARSIYVSHGGGEVYSVQGQNTSGAQRVWVTFTYAGGTAEIRFYNGAAAAGGDVYWSAFLFEETGIPQAVFDGDSLEASWVGTEYASTSKWMEDRALLISDPDCPVVPVAPQPPGITPDCPRTVDEWRRYWTEIPAELSGGWREAVPVVTLSTASGAVRDVRVRFHANPLGTDVTESDPCGFCGEFYISYIPASTVMTIDGIRERVTANVAGTGEANAMHLASDNDYGPVRWPVLTCDIPYYMTIDIAPDEVLDLDVRVAIAQRE